MSELMTRLQMDLVFTAALIRHSRRGVVLTGAGISTASGIPDFRSTDSGLWQRYDPFDVASLASFRYHPEKFFNFIRPLAQDIAQAQPNSAHLSLASLQQAGYLQTIITQNIDGLHQRAGSVNIHEVHGSLGNLTCIDCYRKVSHTDYIERFIQNGVAPKCPSCGAILKPDIVLFGEQLPHQTWLNSVEACQQCDLMIVMGSSLEVLPVARLPFFALEAGAHLVLITRTETYLDQRSDVVIHEDLNETIPQIAHIVLGG
jgi:NAD-dependent deacetylase